MLKNLNRAFAAARVVNRKNPVNLPKLRYLSEKSHAPTSTKAGTVNTPASTVQQITDDSPVPPSSIPPPKNSEVTINYSTETKLAQAGCEYSDPRTGAIVPPITLSTTFERDENLEFSRGFNYSRIKNPSRLALEKAMQSLENGRESFAFASGMQCATAIFTICPHAHVILPDDLYHGVYVLLIEVFQAWGVTFEKIDMTNHTAVQERLNYFKYKENHVASHAHEHQPVHSPTVDVPKNPSTTSSSHATSPPTAATTPNTNKPSRKVIFWIETPSNPTCKVLDIAKLSKMVKTTLGPQRSLVVVDATWATPLLLQPLTLGADISLHSTTKYISGHSDCTGGVLTIGESDEAKQIQSKLQYFHQVGGGILSPFDSWLTLRGLRTLHVRMKQHCDNAMAIAEYLNGHKSVEKVFYPGLPNHPQHKLALQQMDGKYSGMVSFLVKDKEPNSTKNALQVVKSVKLFKRATSLGGTESLIEHRASVEGTYGNCPKNLLRLSIGLEEVGDLIADLEIALTTLTKS